MAFPDSVTQSHYSSSSDACNVNEKIASISSMNTVSDLNLVLVFEAVWRLRHISRAAAELGVSQPTISNALRRLRSQMQDALFIRGGRTMVPTPLAERLAPYWSSGIVSIRRGSAERLGFAPVRDRRLFSLLMTDIAEAIILPQLLEACRVTAPNISFRTTQLNVEQTAAALRSGEVDLAIGFLPSLRSGVKQQHLFDSDYVVIARKDHPATTKGRLSRASFLASRHAIAEAAGTGHIVVEQVLKRLGRANQIGTRVPHFLALPMIVGASDLLATVPRPLALLMLKTAPIALYEHPIRFSKLAIRQFWHERFDADPGIRWLRQTLRNSVQKAEILKSS
jgi:DNA-binding transcriptional LysR family regulator